MFAGRCISEENDVTRILKEVGDAEPVPTDDAKPVTQVAGRHRRRTRYLLAASVVAGASAAAGLVLAVQPSRASEHRPDNPRDRLAPGCDVAATVALSGHAAGSAAILASPAVNSAATFEGHSPHPAMSRSSTPNCSFPSREAELQPAAIRPCCPAMPPNCRPTSWQGAPCWADTAVPGQSLTVTFSAKEGGAYPVLYLIHYVDTASCAAAAGGVVETSGQLGVVDVG